MTSTNITEFRKKLFSYVKHTLTYNNPIHVTSKDGDVVVISAEEYNGLLATMELMREPHLVNSIMEARNEPLESCVEYDPNEEW